MIHSIKETTLRIIIIIIIIMQLIIINTLIHHPDSWHDYIIHYVLTSKRVSNGSKEAAQ